MPEDRDSGEVEYRLSEYRKREGRKLILEFQKEGTPRGNRVVRLIKEFQHHCTWLESLNPQTKRKAHKTNKVPEESCTSEELRAYWRWRQHIHRAKKRLEDLEA